MLLCCHRHMWHDSETVENASYCVTDIVSTTLCTVASHGFPGNPALRYCIWLIKPWSETGRRGVWRWAMLMIWTLCVWAVTLCCITYCLILWKGALWRCFTAANASFPLCLIRKFEGLSGGDEEERPGHADKGRCCFRKRIRKMCAHTLHFAE